MLAATLSFAELVNQDLMGSRDPDLLAIIVVVAAALVLWWRRSHPVLVLALTMAIVSVSYAREYATYLSPIGLTGYYSVAAHVENRRRAWIAMTLAVLGLFTVASFTLLDGQDGYRFGDAVSLILWVSAAAAAGAVVRNRHELFLGTEARADKAEAERAVAADRAVAGERLRIAREMHDVVTHGIGVMAVQAAAARETLDIQPDRTRDLLLSIENTGRESLMEMRRMLGVLRNGEDNQPVTETRLSPQPSLADLEKLVTSCIDAGTLTELVVSGDPTPLAPGVELAAFRIVQEALTNVRKHGGAVATVRIELRYTPDNLHLTITDTGRGATTKPSTNDSRNGLVGMRERVDAYGGELSAGPRPGGGYQVSAQLPTTPHQNRHHRDTPQPNATSPS